MEEKHEIIAPNFISKPSSMSSPTHAPYKHIAAKVELKGIRLTIFKGVNPKLARAILIYSLKPANSLSMSSFSTPIYLKVIACEE